MKEAIVKREHRKFGEGIVFEQEPGETVFSAELNANGIFTCSWPCNQSIDVFREAVESAEGTVEWTEKSNNVKGTVDDRSYAYVKMSKSSKAVVWIESIPSEKRDLILQNTLNIAMKTIAKPLNMPLNIKYQLKSLFKS